MLRANKQLRIPGRRPDNDITLRAARTPSSLFLCADRNDLSCPYRVLGGAHLLCREMTPIKRTAEMTCVISLPLFSPLPRNILRSGSPRGTTDNVVLFCLNSRPLLS